MNKFKDFIYDKSDIIVALVIISIAGLVVFTRIDAILSYPEAFAANVSSTSQDSGKAAVTYTTEGAVTGSAITEEPVDMRAVYINYGESLQVIADKFVAVNLFSTSDEFLTAIESADAATKIKSGNFIIPSNATAEEVITIITKPGL